VLLGILHLSPHIPLRSLSLNWFQFDDEFEKLTSFLATGEL